MKRTHFKERSLEKIGEFLKNRDEVVFAYVFGSFVEGETFNDIDLAVYVDESHPAAKDTFYDVKLSLQLEKILNYPVDVVLLNRANSIIVFRASQGILIKSSNEDLRVDFVTRHWKLYWDIWKKIEEYAKERD